jgi:hypothetical protein
MPPAFAQVRQPVCLDDALSGHVVSVVNLVLRHGYPARSASRERSASPLKAIEDARLRSFNGPPQVVTRVTGREPAVIRRFEKGREVRADGPAL